MRIATEILIEKYRDNLFAAAFHICKNQADAEDVLQDTFLLYHLSEKEFKNEQHIRAWLFRVVINKSKDVVRSFWRRNRISLEDYMQTLTFGTPESRDLFSTVMDLPEKYRIVIHLFYYEDYSIREIAEIMNLSENNVKVRLSRGRKLLKEKLKEGWNDDE